MSRWALWTFLVAPVVAMPHFDINLDLPPRQRWLEVTKYYRQEILTMMDTWEAMLQATLQPAEKADWLRYGTDNSEEYQEELLGIYEGLGTNLSFSLDTLNLFNILYEMGSPTLTQACSGLLAADVNGKVIHGRNMDYQFLFKMPDETIKDWPDVTFEAYFWKGGRRIFMGIQWPIYIGVHTAMRFNGWSFEQNTRLGMNDPQLNLESAKGGGKPYGFLVRKLMETTPDFETALSKINATSFLAPQYFILAGAKPFEGAVISMDRFSAQNLSATPPVRRFSDSAGPWFLLQTNDDANKFPLDHGRPMTATILAMHGQQDVSINFVWDIVHNFPLKNHMSVFTWVAVPSTNYSQAVLRGEDPVLEEENTVALHDAPETEEVQLLQRFLRRYGAKGRRHVISQEGLRLLET